MFVKNKQTKKNMPNKNLGRHKGNEFRLWDGKKIICKYSLLKKCFKTIIIP